MTALELELELELEHSLRVGLLLVFSVGALFWAAIFLLVKLYW